MGSVNFFYFCKSDVSAVQSHPIFWYQSKGRMRLLISPSILIVTNLGPILHRFGDIAGFCAPDPTIFHPILGVFPLDQIADVGVNASRCLKLFGREIIFEVFQPV